MALLFALFCALVALRQIALHVIPGEGGYGTALFGLHLYTWSFLVSIAIIIYSTIILGVDVQYHKFQIKLVKWQVLLRQVMLILVLLLLAGNLIAVCLECGLGQCPDNPMHYLILGGNS